LNKNVKESTLAYRRRKIPKTDIRIYNKICSILYTHVQASRDLTNQSYSFSCQRSLTRPSQK
jgi:hypothetical protein